MERLYSQIVGTSVRDDDFARPITTVKDIVIDPESGKLLALIVNLAKNLVIAPMDILAWNATISIHNRDVMVPGSDILRLTQVQKMGIKIFHNRVYTKGGKYLGIVVDYTIGREDMALRKIYVAKVILGLIRYEHRILPAKKIVEILPEKIVVEDDMETVKEAEKAKMEDLAVG